MYTFFDARAALSYNFEISNRYGSDLLDDIAHWIVGRGSWVLDLPASPTEADRYILANARKIVREYFDYVDFQKRW